MFTKPRSGGDLGCCPGSHDSGSRETDELRGAGPRLIHTGRNNNNNRQQHPLLSRPRIADTEGDIRGRTELLEGLNSEID